MSPSAHRNPPSDPPPEDVDIVDERSSVRPRFDPEPPKRKSQESGEWNADERVQRSSRVEHLVRLGKLLLADLPADHPRARVLRAAIARRDAVVLEGLLSSWNAEASSRTARESLVPPPDDDD